VTDVLQVLILSGHMTREHDNEFRSFRQHNQWLTTLLEDTGRFRVRVVEDPRGLGAEIIDKYDVVIVVFEGRTGTTKGGRLRCRDRRGAPPFRAR
jgi:Trehalose utilisation.